MKILARFFCDYLRRRLTRSLLWVVGWISFAWDWIKYLFNFSKRKIHVAYLRTKRFYLCQQLARAERNLNLAVWGQDRSPFEYEPNE